MDVSTYLRLQKKQIIRKYRQKTVDIIAGWLRFVREECHDPGYKTLEDSHYGGPSASCLISDGIEV